MFPVEVIVPSLCKLLYEATLSPEVGSEKVITMFSAGAAFFSLLHPTKVMLDVILKMMIANDFMLMILNNNSLPCESFLFAVRNRDLRSDEREYFLLD